MSSKHLTLIALLLCLSCRGEPPQSAPTPPSPMVRAPTTTAPPTCSDHTRGQCAASPDCTLELARPAPDAAGPPTYSCRPAQGACEEGFVQDSTAEAQAAHCAARPGCQLQEAACYCPCHDQGRTAHDDGPEAADCQCACSGGPPPTCQAAPALSGSDED